MRKKEYLIGIFGILLIGANLRLPITMVPPFLPEIDHLFGLATSVNGLLTTIPLLMFAILSPLVAAWGVRLGNVKVLFYALIILALGSFLRSIPNVWALFIGTITVGIGISGGNVLLPSIIQEYFASKATLITGLYLTTMSVFAAIGTGGIVPLFQKTGYSAAILVLSSFSLFALLLWTRFSIKLPAKEVEKTISRQTAQKYSVKGAKLTWLITLYFGVQSLLAYSLIAWLPSYWVHVGFSTTLAGLLMTFFVLVGIPMTMLIPFVARTKQGTLALTIVIGLGMMLGTLSLIISSQNFGLNLFCAILLGMTTVSAFSLSIVFFQQKTSSYEQTAELSGTAQSIGYLLAGTGPLLSGILVDHFHSWPLVFAIYVGLACLLLLVGIVIAFSKPIKG